MGVVIVIRDESKLRAINKLKTDFVSLASHQLRTPLTGIKWFVELLRENMMKSSEDDKQNYINKIDESNQRLIDLVDDLLIVGRAEEGKLNSENLEKYRIKELMEEAILLQGRLLTDRKINIEGIESISKDFSLEVNKMQIVQVFGNLINNAARYSSVGSRIMVRVEKEGNSYKIAVKDEGMGIPESQKQRIFEKFFRAENVEKNVPGTGLGLYLTKSIVEGHGGSVWFESQEGKGTTFFVKLPIKQKKDG